MSPDPAAGQPPVRDPARDALWAFAAVLVMVAVFVRINVHVPGIGHLGSALIAVVFLYTPSVVARMRGEDVSDYGFVAAPIGRGLVTAGAAMAAIFPLFALGYLAFYEIACDSQLLAHLVPRGMCIRYGGVDSVHWPNLDLAFVEFCLVQLIVVALPEELFFRGFLLGLLERAFPPRRRWWGGGVGKALILSSLAFAVIHLPKDGDPRALATFFPGLLFGWMRSRTGSILAPTLTHAASNIIVVVLDKSFLR